MRNDIFNPTLTEIFSGLHEHLTNGSTGLPQRHLILSGILAECPYVHSFIQSRLKSFQDLSGVVMIKSSNELVLSLGVV